MYTDTHTFLFEGERQLNNIKSGSFCTLLDVHIHIVVLKSKIKSVTTVIIMVFLCKRLKKY